MSVKITPEIVKALRSLIDEWGSALEIERRTDVANSSISRYLSGHLTRMNDSTWRVLYPHLLKYLPESAENRPKTPATQSSEEIFRRIVHDDTLSNDDKIRFLKLIVPPPEMGSR